MKRLPLAIIIAASLAAGSCAKDDKPTPDQAYAAQKGREDAAKAAKARPGSMEREKALLHIRATEHKILQAASDSTAAKAYKNAAESYLDSAGVLNIK